MKLSDFAIYAILLTGIFFAGCRKGNPTYGIGKVKSKITCTAGNCTTVMYSYDPQDRISTVTYSNLNADHYVYEGDSIKDASYTYCLGTDGLANYQILNGSPGFFYAIQYSNGYLVNKTLIGPTETYSYTIDNGNVVTEYYSRAALFGGAGIYDSTAHTFYSDIDNRDYGLAFMGRSSTNLVKTDSLFTSTQPHGSYTSYTSNSSYFHTYSFDGMHRVYQDTMVGGDPVSTSITTYTYY